MDEVIVSGLAMLELQRRRKKMLLQVLQLEVQAAEGGAKNDILRLPLGGVIIHCHVSREVSYDVSTLGFSAAYLVVRLSVIKMTRPSRKVSERYGISNVG